MARCQHHRPLEQWSGRGTQKTAKRNTSFRLRVLCINGTNLRVGGCEIVAAVRHCGIQVRMAAEAHFESSPSVLLTRA